MGTPMFPILQRLLHCETDLWPLHKTTFTTIVKLMRCHSQRDREQPVPPNQIGHYSPVWKDCLEEAKVECRAMHALSNPWPKLKMDANSLTDSLTTVVAQWTQRGIRFKPGKSLPEIYYCIDSMF